MAKSIALIFVWLVGSAFALTGEDPGREVHIIKGVEATIDSPLPVMQTAPVTVIQSSSALATTIATGVISLLGTIFTGIMAYLMARLNNKATAMQGTANTAVQKGNEALSVAKDVHKLVDGHMRIAIEANAGLARRIANLTGTANDEQAAVAAEQALVDHDSTESKLKSEKNEPPVIVVERRKAKRKPASQGV